MSLIGVTFWHRFWSSLKDQKKPSKPALESFGIEEHHELTREQMQKLAELAQTPLPNEERGFAQGGFIPPCGCSCHRIIGAGPQNFTQDKCSHCTLLGDSYSEEPGP